MCGYMYIVFYSTSDVFKAEEIINNNNIECRVVPTPVQDKAYCGVCLEVQDGSVQDLMVDMEFAILE